MLYLLITFVISDFVNMLIQRFLSGSKCFFSVYKLSFFFFNSTFFFGYLSIVSYSFICFFLKFFLKRQEVFFLSLNGDLRKIYTDLLILFFYLKVFFRLFG